MATQSGTVNDAHTTLFNGTKFWFAQRVPTRDMFIARVEANGGIVVRLEALADIKIVDHTRRDLPTGTFSFQYIERSLRNGALENLEDHRAGPSVSTTRDAGSTIQATKGTRTPFSADDDRILREWVAGHAQKTGGTRGNAIYQQLERENPRHTWQSWRSRWVDNLSKTPRPADTPNNAPPTPPSEITPGDTAASSTTPSGVAYDNQDIVVLRYEAPRIVKFPEMAVEEAWARLASDYPRRSPNQWREIWETRFGPTYALEKAKENSQASQIRLPPGLNTEKLRNDTTVVVHGEEANSKDQSPSYQPESPVMKPRVDGASPKPVEKLDVAHDVSRDSGPVKLSRARSESPSMELVSNGNGLGKRKRHSAEEKLSHSLFPTRPNILDSDYVHRKSQGHHEVEIPSTPERRPLGSAAVPVAIQQDVIDLGSEAGSDDESKDAGGESQVLLSTPQLKSRFGLEAFQSEDQDGFSDPVGLDVPFPPGDVRIPGDKSLEEGLYEAHADTTHKGRDLDTQMIFRERTPLIDLSVPEPYDGWDEPIPSSSPPIPEANHIDTNEHSNGQQEAQLSEQNVNRLVNEWVRTNASLGHSADNIEQALTSSTMDLQLADIVLETLASGGTIPENRMGIWTDQDDEDLKATDARRIDRLWEKHGQDGYDRRYRFLMHYHEDT